MRKIEEGAFYKIGTYSILRLIIEATLFLDYFKRFKYFKIVENK
jgi:hypothetical protein